MKLDYLEISGFRGFLTPERIDFGDGFTIITGRNGTGKSTILDAIDFLLTGSINSFSIEGTQENKSRHIWWEGKDAEYYVKVGFVSLTGKKIEIVRSSKSGLNLSEKEIMEFFEQNEGIGDYEFMLQNSLIRGETITNLCMKITTQARIELVQSLFGDIEYSGLLKIVNEVIKTLNIQLSDFEYIRQGYVKNQKELDNGISLLENLKKKLENLKSNQKISPNKEKAHELISIENEVRNNLSESGRQSENISKELNEVNRIRKKHQELIKIISEYKNDYNRITNEIVKEKIDALTPIYKELFARLKPHQEWNDIDIELNEDLEKSINLVVGENLDPNYLFSSGQRKISSFAFLLAIFLSRPWSNWSILMLDDPFDQVDGFHTMNLAEVLYNIIREGNQIVATVENPAIAKFLSRRLRGVGNRVGNVYELTTETSNGSVTISEMEEIAPVREYAFNFDVEPVESTL